MAGTAVEKIDLEEARQLRDEGWSWRKLGKRYGVNFKTVQYHLDENFPHKKHKLITYFIQSYCGDYVKIGKTRNIYQRLEKLSVASPMPLKLLGITDENEADMHVLFAHYHFRREWFVLTEEVKQWVVDNCREKP